MNQFPLPVICVGTQPAEGPQAIEDAQLDYLQMPGEMSTYSAPVVPEADEVRGLTQGMAVLEDLLSALYRYDGKLKAPIDLLHLDDANRELVDQVLGDGDVSVVIDGMARTQIQEAVLAGVWRVQSTDDAGNLLSDHIEVASVPWMVGARSFDKAQKRIEFENEALPEGVMNAPPLLTEINDRIAKVSHEGGMHAINLSLLPQTEQDLAFLNEKLRHGKVVILSRGYGNCRITSTGTAKVWWVQYFNSQDSMILNTLEITAVPEVACAAAEDIADSAQRLNEILDVYRDVNRVEA